MVSDFVTPLVASHRKDNALDTVLEKERKKIWRHATFLRSSLKRWLYVKRKNYGVWSRRNSNNYRQFLETHFPILLEDVLLPKSNVHYTQSNVVHHNGTSTHFSRTAQEFLNNNRWIVVEDPSLGLYVLPI